MVQAFAYAIILVCLGIGTIGFSEAGGIFPQTGCFLGMVAWAFLAWVVYLSNPRW
jgi:hypothetical protein